MPGLAPGLTVPPSVLLMVPAVAQGAGEDIHRGLRLGTVYEQGSAAYGRGARVGVGAAEHQSAGPGFCHATAPAHYSLDLADGGIAHREVAGQSLKSQAAVNERRVPEQIADSNVPVG